MMVLGYSLDPLTVIYMLFNFVVSVGIVFANKYVFHHFHFDFATLMTALHFFGTFVLLAARSMLTVWDLKCGRPTHCGGGVGARALLLAAMIIQSNPPTHFTTDRPNGGQQRRGRACW